MDEHRKSCERHMIANKESASEIRNKHLIKAYQNPKSPVKDINEKHSIFKYKFKINKLKHIEV